MWQLQLIQRKIMTPIVKSYIFLYLGKYIFNFVILFSGNVKMIGRQK